jgi:hypothetical protein
MNLLRTGLIEQFPTLSTALQRYTYSSYFSQQPPAVLGIGAGCSRQIVQRAASKFFARQHVAELVLIGPIQSTHPSSLDPVNRQWTEDPADDSDTDGSGPGGLSDRQRYRKHFRSLLSPGLAVSFSATGNCTVSGPSVHLTGAGSCTITASQAGNANFKPAASVQRSLSIRSQSKFPKKPKAPAKERACIAKAKAAFRQDSKAARRLRGRRAREKALSRARQKQAKRIAACKDAS